MVRKSVQAGYCDYPDYICALEKSECPDAIFRSSREMQGAPERAHGGVCLLQETTRENLLGNCVSETSGTVCSPNKDSCDGFGDFHLSGACMVDDTKFGQCGDNQCAWSPENCLDSEEWNFPSENCSCDQVKVGACEKDGDIFCAVSSDACDDKSEWLSPLDLSVETNVDCFLCNEIKTAPASSSIGGDSTSSSFDNPNLSPYYSGSEPSSISSSSTSAQGLQPIVIISTIVGVVAIIAVTLAALIRLRQVKASMQQSRKAVVPPPATFTLQKTSDSDNVSILQDDVSVL